MKVFWVAMLCGLVGGYQCFGGTKSLYLLSERTATLKMEVPPNTFNQLQDHTASQPRRPQPEMPFYSHAS
jgi:hypothetical protein